MTNNNTDKGRSLQYIRILYENRHQGIPQLKQVVYFAIGMTACVEKYLGRSTEIRINKLLPVLRP